MLQNIHHECFISVHMKPSHRTQCVGPADLSGYALYSLLQPIMLFSVFSLALKLYELPLLMLGNVENIKFLILHLQENEIVTGEITALIDYLAFR